LPGVDCVLWDLRALIAFVVTVEFRTVGSCSGLFSTPAIKHPDFIFTYSSEFVAYGIKLEPTWKGISVEYIAVRNDEIQKILNRFCSTQGDGLYSLARQIAELFSKGGQLLVAGGGQMQPLAQMLVSAFVFRLEFERPSLPAVALGADAVLSARLHAAGLHDQLLARHYRSLTSAEHLVLMFNDGSVAPALDLLREEVVENDQPLALISSKGEGDPLSDKDCVVTLDLGTTQIAKQQELGLFCAHLLCELVEKELFGC
jgi:D-sedoheptulose 7-phosphate isomerase